MMCIKERSTVSAGFVIGILGETDLLEYIKKDELISEKWDELKKLFEEGRYRVPDKVSKEAHDLFQQILVEVEKKFGLVLPRHSDELNLK